MDVTRLPFNQRVGIARAGEEPYLLELPASPEMGNHLGTVHASAQFALAEATSGQFMVREFPQLEGRALAVVRTYSGKFRSPARGVLRSTANIEAEARAKFSAELERRGRATVSIDVEVHDAAGTVTLAAQFDWFVQTP